jgi:hypothetical protein
MTPNFGVACVKNGYFTQNLPPLCPCFHPGGVHFSKPTLNLQVPLPLLVFQLYFRGIVQASKDSQNCGKHLIFKIDPL